MSRKNFFFLPIVMGLSAALTLSAAAETRPGMAEILEASQPSDWRPLDPENTLYLEMEGGRVIMELAPDLAPGHVAQIKKLAREGFYDGLTIYRVQENYVAQGGDGDGGKPLKTAPRQIKGELYRQGLAGLSFTPLPDGDVYAKKVGFSKGFAVGLDPAKDQAWLLHCPGALGMARENGPDTGGTEFYVVIGHAPRHLDRNATLFGRVVKGMSILTTLPRGSGPLGMYEENEPHQPIKSVRVAADLPEDQRERLEVMRTDSATFQALIESRRNRPEPWFLEPAGHIGICNAPIPVRSVK